jgi:hypothetical protein
MEKTKRELEDLYKDLVEKLVANQRVQLQNYQPVSSEDNFRKISYRHKESDKEKKILDEIIDTVEKYNGLLTGSIKSKLPPEKDFSKKLSDAIITLSKDGWFINYEMSPAQIYKASDLLIENKIFSLNTYIGNIIKKDLPVSEEILIARHSDRKEALMAAFRAHSMSEYYLSIPVFLAQTDGISNEICNIHIFKKPNRLKKWVPKNSKEQIHKIMCSALLELEKGEFHGQYKRKNFTTGISRHSILHGDNNSYGNEINSLKAISLLRYVSDVISPKV